MGYVTLMIVSCIEEFGWSTRESGMSKGEVAARRGAAMLVAVCLLSLLLPGVSSPAAPVTTDGPRLMRSTPRGGEVLGRDTAIVLSFDRQMDPVSLAQAVSFEPPVAFSVSGESECMVVPDVLLNPNTAYAFRLRPGIAEDLEGRVFESEVAITFTTRGDGVTMEIPAFSFQGEIVEGKDPQGVTSVIGFGVGHYPGTGRPGKGNFVIMAHASGQIDFPFNHLFDLRDGDVIILTYGGRDYLYRWSEGRVVEETEMWILDPTTSPVLTAFVCCAENGRPSPTFHPDYRYAMRAVLFEATP
jgi:LPXTG-site transpeptidase (sortase) family protein